MNEVINALLQLGALTVTVVGSYALSRLAGWLGVKQDGDVRRYLQDALGIAIAAGEKRLALELRGATPDQVQELHAEVIAEATTYVASKVPGALEHLGIGDMGLRDMVERRLPPILSSLQAAAAGRS